MTSSEALPPKSKRAVLRDLSAQEKAARVRTLQDAIKVDEAHKIAPALTAAPAPMAAVDLSIDTVSAIKKRLEAEFVIAKDLAAHLNASLHHRFIESVRLVDAFEREPAEAEKFRVECKQLRIPQNTATHIEQLIARRYIVDPSSVSHDQRSQQLSCALREVKRRQLAPEGAHRHTFVRDPRRSIRNDCQSGSAARGPWCIGGCPPNTGSVGCAAVGQGAPGASRRRLETLRSS